MLHSGNSAHVANNLYCMLEISHAEEPEILKRYKEENPGPYTSDSWKHFKDYESAIARDKVVVKSLHSMQEGLCVYCERKVFRTEHERVPGERERQVEHIKSRRDYPQETLTYSNLALSCISRGSRLRMTCGDKKGAQVLPILPTERHRHLFDINFNNGEIIPSLSASAQEKADVERCVHILNLNDSALAAERRAIVDKIAQIQSDGDLHATDVQERISEYCTEKTRRGEPFAPTFRKAFKKLIGCWEEPPER